MKTSHLTSHSLTCYLDAEPPRRRAKLPAIQPRHSRSAPAFAEHDFLVSNPRPDLTREITPAILERD